MASRLDATRGAARTTAHAGAADVFICHASEDKAEVARPLAALLRAKGLNVWLDESALTLGDSLNQQIEAALATTRFGIVILSPSFFPKHWAQRELAGLTAREAAANAKVILPVWHNIDARYLTRHAPVLADRVGVRTSEGLPKVADEVLRALERADSMPRGPSTGPSDAGMAPSRARRRVTRGSLSAGGTALACGAIAFFATPASAPSNGAGPTNRATAQSLDVAVPRGWQVATASHLPRGVHATSLVSLSSTTRPIYLDVGVTSTSSPTLLPNGLAHNALTGSRRETIALGGLYYYRYRGLQTAARQRLVAVYVTNTDHGALLASCTLSGSLAGPVGQPACERIVASVRLHGLKPLTLGPQRVFASALRSAITMVNAARARWGALLYKATTAKGQSAIAARLADAHRRAAAIVEAAASGPSEAGTRAAVIEALEGVALGYDAVSIGATARSRTAFDSGRQTVEARTAELVSAVRRMAEFGYRLAA